LKPPFNGGLINLAVVRKEIILIPFLMLKTLP